MDVLRNPPAWAKVAMAKLVGACYHGYAHGAVLVSAASPNLRLLLIEPERESHLHLQLF